VADVPGHGLTGAVIAALLDPTPQLTDVGRRWVVGDGGRLGNGVRVDHLHAGEPAEGGLDDGLLARPLQALDLEDRGGHTDGG